jgi:hypothetical protein
LHRWAMRLRLMRLLSTTTVVRRGCGLLLEAASPLA